MAKVCTVSDASGRSIGTILIGTFVLAAATGCPSKESSDVESTAQAVQPKVTICHRGETISVAQPAVPAHLQHGDTIGACVDGGADASVDAGTDASVDASVDAVIVIE